MADSLDSAVEEALLEELRGQRAAPEPPKPTKPPKPDFIDGISLGVEPHRMKKFSEIFGFVPPSGIDHEVTSFRVEEWAENIQSYIPQLDEGYVFQPEATEMLVVGMEMGDNVYMSGPTGSGKSTLTKNVCALLNRPFIRFNGRGDMESSAMLGQLTAKEGSTVWEDGTFTEAAKEGLVVGFDEMTATPQEIQFALQWLLENDGKLLLQDKPGTASDKIVTPHPEFRLVASDNTRGLGDSSGSFSGTNVLNTATLDRFGTVIYLNYMPKSDEMVVLKNKYPELTDQLAEKMMQFAWLIRESYTKGDLSFTLSPRSMLNWVKKSLYYKDEVFAFRMSYMEKLEDDSERDAVKGFFRTVFNKEL